MKNELLIKPSNWKMGKTVQETGGNMRGIAKNEDERHPNNQQLAMNQRWDGEEKRLSQFRLVSHRLDKAIESEKWREAGNGVGKERNNTKQSERDGRNGGEEEGKGGDNLEVDKPPIRIDFKEGHRG